MKCPSCAVNLPDNTAQCPSCGINFERWKKRAAEKAEEERIEKLAAIAAFKRGLPELEKATDFDPFLGRKIAAAFILVWIFVGGLFLSCYRPARQRRLVPLPPELRVGNSTAAAAASPDLSVPEPEPESERK